jgi:hypothetical protein
MRRLALLAAAPSLAALALTLGPVSPAQADTPGCVTRTEYNRIDAGDSRAHVAAVFDTSGRREAVSHSGGHTMESRSYKACGKKTRVGVTYRDGKVLGKLGPF